MKLTPVAELGVYSFRAWRDHYRAITAMTRDLLSLLHLVDERNTIYLGNTCYKKKTSPEGDKRKN